MSGRVALVVLAAILAAIGCSQPPPPPAKPVVVASFYPLWEFSRQVAGDRAEVLALVPPGVEPHDWEPSPADVIQLEKARVLVYNGAGFESWVNKLLPDVRAKNVLAVNATHGMELLTTAAPDEHGHAGQKAKTADPHVWLDPVRAQAQVDAIRAALQEADPANKGVYEENARAFKTKLAALHDAFDAGLKHCARRDLVVSHAAFGYIASRYKLTQIAVLGLSPDADPSPADLARIVRFARRKKVKYIFFETLISSRLASTLAREVGAKTLVLNPVEGLTQEEAASGRGYLDLMQTNLENLRTGLECR